MTNQTDFDAIVVGAGAAGIAAAATLRNAGKKVAVLEARDRIGGRVLTLRIPESDFPIELGAEFMHGRPEVLSDHFDEAERVPEAWWRRTRGKLVRADGVFKHVEAVFRSIQRELGDRDESFASAIARVKELHKANEIEETRAFVAGFYNAPLDDVSAQATIGAAAGVGSAEDDGAYRLRAGYAAVFEKYLAMLHPLESTVQLDTVVEEVRWRPGRVAVFGTRDDQPFSLSAAQAVITLPVAVWKSVRFQPALAEKDEALRYLGMGAVHRVVLRFRTPLWEQGDFRPGYLQYPKGPFVTFWTARPWNEARFVAWSGGSQTGDIREGRVEQAMECLSRGLGISLKKLDEELLDAHYHDWSRDPFSLGAYSYTRPGGEGASQRLARCIADTLFFAGEACHPKDRTGTVDGAIETGINAAREALHVPRLEATG